MMKGSITLLGVNAHTVLFGQKPDCRRLPSVKHDKIQDQISLLEVLSYLELHTH